MTSVPLSRAWLALWPAAEGDPPKLRVRLCDGPPTRDQEAWLSRRGGWSLDLSAAGESPAAVYDRFAASPGWADQGEALAAFAAIDRDPAYREELQAAIARRRAVIGDTTDWLEAARRLAAAGHDDAGIRMALEAGSAR